MSLDKAKRIIKTLFVKHELTSWKFEFDRAKRRLGCCKHRKRLITLSKEMVRLNSEEIVTDTMLHEIAHALTPGHRHDRVWKMKCIEIGATPSRCVENKNYIPPKRKYTATCPVCKTEFQESRIKTVSCGECCNHYDIRYKLEYKLN